MVPVTLNRVWQRARKTIGRTDLHYHDLRHTGLTWAAASGASIAELMRRGGMRTRRRRFVINTRPRIAITRSLPAPGHPK
jgi:integrase